MPTRLSENVYTLLIYIIFIYGYIVHVVLSPELACDSSHLSSSNSHFVFCTHQHQSGKPDCEFFPVITVTKGNPLSSVALA